VLGAADETICFLLWGWVRVLLDLSKETLVRHAPELLIGSFTFLLVLSLYLLGKSGHVHDWLCDPWVPGDFSDPNPVCWIIMKHLLQEISEFQ